jgi:pentose-5-phosphate-3-epimerase
MFMQTVPSILEKDVSSLFYQIKKLSPYFPRFQIDIADGIFVPNKTVSLDNLISVLKKQSNNETMKQCIFDFHLMVKNYQVDIRKIESLKKIINIKYIFIHYSAIVNCKFLPAGKAGKIENYSSLPIGLTLNPDDQISDLASKYNLNKIPFIQIMSVNPGFQGTPFLPETLNKIEQLRNMGYRKEIFLDGAVNEKTIPVILSKKYQPDYICPGSFLTKTKTLEKNVKYLKKLKLI